MKIECVIYQEDIRVPVRFTCFTCSDQKLDKPVCNSINRVCIHCADTYLSLNKNYDSRPNKIRCLTCPCVVNPRFIYKKENAYRKDYFLMSIDENKYTCPHSECGCSFVGTQSELNHHMSDSCIYRIIECFGKSCGFYQVSEFENHKKTCILYKKCEFCNDYILNDNIINHMKEKHDLIKCNYCSNFKNSKSIKNHEDICLQRPIKCKICSKSYPIIIMINHYNNHIRSLKNLINKYQIKIIKSSNIDDSKLYKQYSDDLFNNTIKIQQYLYEINFCIKYNKKGLYPSDLNLF